MSAEPEAIRAFEHAGWQRAAAVYTDSFAHATAPFIKPLLEVAEFSPGQHVLDVACGPGHLAAAAAASHLLDVALHERAGGSHYLIGDDDRRRGLRKDLIATMGGAAINRMR